jgi:LytS/YehU family sensor histidine kinase
MEHWTATLNTFFANTCVIVVFAYILTRAWLMSLLSQEQPRDRKAVLLGGVFGLMGLLELYFASARFPYDTYTLIVTFAVVNAGFRVGIATALFIALGSFLFLSPETVLRTSLALFSSVALAAVVRSKLPDKRHRFAAGLLAMVLAEGLTVLIRLWLPGPVPAPFSESVALARIAANGFGIILLQLIVSDALVRAQSEQHRIEAERNRTLQAESQLNDLRARLHPHFLFNTLTSIAGLCTIAPEKAEQTIVQLSHIMRRAMENQARPVVSLQDELEYVRDYVAIEQLRMDSRLCVNWKIAPDSESAPVPPFSVQILVENAINHGIAPKPEAGTVTITTHRRRDYVLIAIQDDGVGMEPETRLQALTTQQGNRTHGLQILNQQLLLLYGGAARLRLFSTPDTGTLVTFAVPVTPPSSPLRPGQDPRRKLEAAQAET